MATMTIEYNEKDKYTKQVLTGLIGSGMFRRINEVKNQKIASFRSALHAEYTKKRKYVGCFKKISIFANKFN